MDELYSISVEIQGIQFVKNTFKKLRKFLDNVKPTMQSIGTHLLKSYRLNFTSEGSRLGKSWKQLAPVTVLDRSQQGFGAAHPILHRTGKMKRGFKAIIGKDTLTIENTVPYFKYHQRGTPRIPKRVMLFFNTKLRAETVEIFCKMLVKSLNGNI